MNLETFFEKFDQLADAPDAVEKMRELVLDLAVRGKLVVQNLTDEPAAQLLKRVLAEKNRRTGRSESVDEESGSPANDEPFEIPVSWEWIGATTPAVMVSDQGKKVQSKDILEAGKYPVVDQGKMFIRGYCDDSDRVISVAEPIVLFGDHTRETKFIDFDFVVGADGVKLLQPICIDPRFYFLVLSWLPLESRGYARHFKLLKAATIPLPPLAEQKRIVAKVDELMALCDQLEAQQQEREEQASQLARASLARFADAPTPANLSYLFHSSFIIHPSDLRKSILTLAVQGKLVPQDPNDEPADALLTRIWRKKSGVEDDDTGTDELPSLNDGFSPPFEIPSTWAWVRATEPTHSISDLGKKIKTKDVAEKGRFPVIDQGKQFIRGYCDDEGKVIRLDSPIVLFGDHTRETKLIDFDFIVGADGVKLLKPVEINPGYYLLALRWLPLDDRGYGRHFKLLRAASIPIPPLAEQRRIVAKVEQLMALVEALETQLAASRATAANLLSALVAEVTASSV